MYRTTKASDVVDIRIASDGVAARPPQTVFEVFKNTVDKYGSKPALSVMKNNQWKRYTWKEYYDHTINFGKSLMAIDFQPFESVNIIGFNSPEWLIANCGAIAAGGLATGIYTTSGPEACFYIAEHSEATVIVVEDQSQLNKYLQCIDKLPKVRALILYTGAKPENIDCSVPVYTFDEFLELGVEIPDSKVQDCISAQKPGNCCTLIYTSGTTGPPKAVMVSHDNVTWTAQVAVEAFGGLCPDDRVISFLPLSHIAAQMMDIHAPMASGLHLYFAQPDALRGSLGKSLKEVRPTILFGVPRVWEKIAEKLLQLGAETQGIKKRIATWAKEKGTAKSQLAQFGNSGGAPCGYVFAHKLVLSKIRYALGLDQCRAIFTGAAPLSLEVLNYFASLDLPVYELFGQTECTGPHSLNLPGKWKLGTCGRSLSGTEMKVNKENEELLLRGRHVCMGYLKMDEKTIETIDDDGWLHTGDCAKIDTDGFMSITGRIKELIITAGGENIAPVIIETALKEHMKALSNCMVIGDKRKFLIVLFTLKAKFDAEGKPLDDLEEGSLNVAKEIGSEATKVSEAQTCPRFKEYFDKGLETTNEKSVSRAQRVGRWALLNHDFSVSGGELTPTMKVRRKVVEELCAGIIDDVYSTEPPAVAKPKDDDTAEAR